MKIERTITISGSTVTIVQSVDTNTPARSQPPGNFVMANRAEVAATPAAAPAAAAPAVTRNPARADPSGGNEPELPDTGGGAVGGGTLIVFGPVTLNFPADCTPPVAPAGDAPKQGALSSPGGGIQEPPNKPPEA